MLTEFFNENLVMKLLKFQFGKQRHVENNGKTLDHESENAQKVLYEHISLRI